MHNLPKPKDCVGRLTPFLHINLNNIRSKYETTIGTKILFDSLTYKLKTTSRSCRGHYNRLPPITECLYNVLQDYYKKSKVSTASSTITYMCI